MAETTNMVADLAKVQGSLPNIKKDAQGNYGKYVTLDAIHEAVLPLLAKNNLAWVTKPVHDGGEVELEYALLHTSGDKIEGSMKLFVSQPNMQQLGSAITYAKRYAICAVLGVTADEDDDGEAAIKAPYKKEVKVSPITSEQITKLLGAAKIKGFTDKEKAMEVVDALAISTFDKKTDKLTLDEATKLYADLIKPQTTKDLLDLLLSDEPF